MAFFSALFDRVGKYLPSATEAFKGFSAYQQYQNDVDAANATKKANAAMMQAAEEEARLTREDAASKALEIKRDAARVRSGQIALYLKSGVTLDGSPMLVTDETQELGDVNARNTITNADSSAKSMILRARAGQQTVKKADLWGTAADVFGSANNIYKNGVDNGWWGKS